MAKFCPVVGHRVVYLTCQECDDRVCERSRQETTTRAPTTNNTKSDDKTVRSEAKHGESTPDKCKADCASCCHKMSLQEEQIGSQKHMIARCEVLRNYLLSYEKVKELGCEHYNKDYSQEKICLNCASYLGGGDWGLACSTHYHRLPTALTEACEQFSPRNN